jgi:hypothetical protein
MPRPISWLPRLHVIRRTVSNSVRSHYDRHELETLFQLQPRAAQKLIEMLPSVKVGTSRLVEREVLVNFLTESSTPKTRAVCLRRSAVRRRSRRGARCARWSGAIWSRYRSVPFPKLAIGAVVETVPGRCA